MTRRLVLSFLLLAAIGADPEILPVPNDAVVHAAADAAVIDPHRAPFVRYVWVPDGDKTDGAAVSFATNTAISRAAIPVRPYSIAGGRLLRIDLLTLLPKDADLKRSVELWEKLAGQDPYFYIRIQQKVAAYKADDGKTYDWKWAVSFGGHVDLKAAVLLQGLTKSAAPVVRFDRFTVKVLTTLDGGLYYDFAGIAKSNKAGQTDFQKFLADHGVDLNRAKELQADRRAALFRSGVTAKPRAIEEIQGLLGTATWSEDIADNNLDPKAHPILTLLESKFDATEAIALKANGHCDFALFDGKGALQQVVPDNIAKDHTVPTPYTARLQPAISCIRCHSQGKGFRTARNDISALLKNRPEDDVRFDILGDFKGGRDALDKIAGLYRGNLDRLDRGREDYSDAVFLSTGGLSVGEVSARIQKIQDDYQFHDVTARIACGELGIGVDEDAAVSMLRKLLPAVEHEDARIGFLKAGVSITRADWEQVYADAALRSRPQYEAIAKEQVKE